MKTIVMVVCVGILFCCSVSFAETMTEMRQKMTNGVVAIDSKVTADDHVIIYVTVPFRGVFLGVESPKSRSISIDWDHPLPTTIKPGF